MARPKSAASSASEPPRRVPTTPEEVERLNIGLAAELASQQLRDGTVSAQVQVHYLKMGEAKYKLEEEKLRGEIKLQEARVHAIESAEKMAELFEGAIKAMVSYTGGDPSEVSLEDFHRMESEGQAIDGPSE